MSALGNYLEDALANEVLRGVAFTALSSTFLSLHNGAGLTESNTDWLATELAPATAISYARVQILAASWNAPVDGICTNNVELTFPIAGSAWGNVTHFALWTTSTSGNLLFKNPLDATRNIQTGDTFKFFVESLDVGFQ